MRDAGDLPAFFSLVSSRFENLEYGGRHAFRDGLIGSGVITATVTSPAEFETASLHALTALPRPEQRATTAAQRRVWTIPAGTRKPAKADGGGDPPKPCLDLPSANATERLRAMCGARETTSRPVTPSIISASVRCRVHL